MTTHAKAKRWRVMRQTSDTPDFEVCSHRLEVLAEACAYRRERRNRSSVTGLGVVYTVYRRPEPEPAEVTAA